MIFEAVEIDKLVYNDSYIGNYDNCVKWWKKKQVHLCNVRGYKNQENYRVYQCYAH